MKCSFVLRSVGFLFAACGWVAAQQFRITDYDGSTVTIEYPPSFAGAYLFFQQNTNLMSGEWEAVDYSQIALVEGAEVLYSPSSETTGGSTNQTEVPYQITPEFIAAVANGEITNSEWVAASSITAPSDGDSGFYRYEAISFVDTDGDGVDNVSEYGAGTDPYESDAPPVTLPLDDGDPQAVPGSVDSAPGDWNTPPQTVYRATIGLHGAINARILAMDGTNGTFTADSTVEELGAWIEAQCGNWVAPAEEEVYPTVDGGRFFQTETNGFAWAGKENIYALAFHPYDGPEQFANHLVKGDPSDPTGLASIGGTNPVLVNASNPWTKEKIEACLPHLVTVSCRLQKLNGGVFDPTDTTAMAQGETQTNFDPLEPVDEIKIATCFIQFFWSFSGVTGWTIPPTGIFGYSRNGKFTFLDRLTEHGFGSTTHRGYVGLKPPYDWTINGFWDKYSLQNALPAGLLTNAISQTFTRTDGESAWLLAEDTNYGTQRTAPGLYDHPPYNPPNSGVVLSGFQTYAAEVLSTFDPPPITEAATLAMDMDRDGSITETNDWDRVDAYHPFRFWVNEDGNNSVYPEAALEDFFPAQIMWREGAGTPNITFKLSANVNLDYVPTAMTTNDTDAYLTELDVAGTLAANIGSLSSGTQTSETFNENDIVLLAASAADTSAEIYVHILENGSEIAVATNHFSFSPVEEMYRIENLRSGGTSSTDEPANWPDNLTNGKDFVFVHGYNVDEAAGHEWNKTIFKRLWHSGSNAKYHAILWDGTPPGDPLHLGPYYYHNAVINAFATAPDFATYLNGLNEPVVMAHSLGNMLTSSAIVDHDAAVSQYYALDAAVALEAYGDASPTNASAMIADNLFDRMDAGLFSDLIPFWSDINEYVWQDYPFESWASEWYRIFDPSDARSKLTWRHRFLDIQQRTDVFNFYSSTEEVLRVNEGFLLFVQAYNKNYAWQVQEHFKGRLNDNLITGIYDGLGGAASEYCGWGFTEEASSSHILDTWGVVKWAPARPRHLHEKLAQENPDREQNLQVLATDPLFRPNPEELFGASAEAFSAGTVAAQGGMLDYNVSNASYPIGNVPMRDWLLAKAFPSRTRPMGSTINSQLAWLSGNFNMSALYMTNPSDWPHKEDSVAKWWHSDIKDVPYAHSHKLFDKITAQERN
ncbi:MAG: hypothetical protein K9L89_05335 [Kiritimatiellales bacterium]|nr:hypothetical protein [Kiritimatiellales bacterium]